MRVVSCLIWQKADKPGLFYLVELFTADDEEQATK